MKRFLVFAGVSYYETSKGFGDLIGCFDDVDAARRKIERTPTWNLYWGQIIDTVSGSYQDYDEDGWSEWVSIENFS